MEPEVHRLYPFFSHQKLPLFKRQIKSFEYLKSGLFGFTLALSRREKGNNLQAFVVGVLLTLRLFDFFFFLFISVCVHPFIWLVFIA